jgi:predicted DsbA family dithiol-disulfide isomerase
MTDTTPSPVTIDVISDVVCPWCFLGKKRLEKALALRPDIPVEVRWRPYQLDPTIPEGGVDRKEYMERKFGTDGRLGSIHERLSRLGADEGIAFAFDAILRSPNTLDAHRLIRWSFAYGGQDELVDALFRAYFEQGRDIGDRATLVTIAEETGFDPDEARAFLAGADAADLVRQEIGMAQEIGVQGVPFFIFGGKYAVSGAEAAETLAKALGQAADEVA